LAITTGKIGAQISLPIAVLTTNAGSAATTRSDDHCQVVTTHSWLRTIGRQSAANVLAVLVCALKWRFGKNIHVPNPIITAAGFRRSGEQQSLVAGSLCDGDA